MISNFRYEDRSDPLLANSGIGKRLLFIENGCDDAAIAEINKGLFGTLHFSWGDWGDFSFLSKVDPTKVKDVWCKFSSSDCESLAGLYHLEHLTRIDIEVLKTKNKKEIFNVQNFKALTSFHVQYFTQYNTEVFNSDILEEVYIYDAYPYADLQFIGQAKNLKRLTLNGSKVKSLAGIENLTKLEEFHLYCSPTTSFAGIEKIPQIKEIECYSLPKLTDISALKDLTNLVKLSFESCNRIDDYSVISANKKLEILGIYAKRIASIDFIRELKELTYVTIADTKVEDADLSVFYDLPKLTRANYHTRREYNVKDSEFSEEAIAARRAANS